MIDDELGEEPKETSPGKRRRSSDSATSSSHMLRNIAINELQTVLTENVAPDLTQRLETRMNGLQQQNMELAQAANQVLGQVQQSFSKIRDPQQVLNNQLSQERLKTSIQDNQLDHLKTHQEAYRQMTHQAVGEARSGPDFKC